MAVSNSTKKTTAPDCYGVVLKPYLKVGEVEYAQTSLIAVCATSIRHKHGTFAAQDN